jgi:hypothetical protein
MKVKYTRHPKKFYFGGKDAGEWEVIRFPIIKKQYAPIIWK